jgi:RHS repeat-associated protein
MSGDLVERRVVEYTRFGDERVVTETAAGKTRTTTTQYDDAARITGESIVADEGVAIGAVTKSYDPATGKLAVTTRGTSTVTREFDQLGRMVTYTDADGGTTSTEYDRFGRSVKISNPTGHRTIAYDRLVEPRGLPTAMTDSIAGTFGARYSPDGQLTELTYPGGLTRTDRLNANQKPIERTYTRDSDAEVIYQESVTTNSTGQWVNHTYTGGSKIYGYDRSGRLTSVRHTSPITEGCVTRTYAYDARSNRTGSARFDPDVDGLCDTTAADEVVSHTHDTADRLTDAGYVYDAFGRTTAMPGGLVNTYHVNDIVARQDLGDTRQTWTLDPADRFRAFTTETLVEDEWIGTTSRLNHYGDESDEVHWTVEDVSTGAVTRNVTGFEDGLLATTSATGDVRLQLTNLHGDVAVVIDTDLAEPEAFDYHEFGTPMAAQSDQRYGWLGGKQRSGESLGGVILMGVRLYSPLLGRFLQVDPEPGGNATDYDYCVGDPINCFDLDGRWSWKKAGNWWKKYGGRVSAGLTIAGMVTCVVATGGACAVVGAIGAGVSIAGRYAHHRAGHSSRKQLVWGSVGDIVGARLPGVRAAKKIKVPKTVRKTRYVRKVGIVRVKWKHPTKTKYRKTGKYYSLRETSYRSGRKTAGRLGLQGGVAIANTWRGHYSW